MKSLHLAAVCVFLCVMALPARAQQRIYTAPDSAAAGGIEGRLTSGELTRAIAVERDRTRVYLGELLEGGKAFRFTHLPVGKYDLTLLTKTQTVLEGIFLGDEDASKLPPASARNLQTRIDASEKFFNRCHIGRIGLDGERALVFLERIRDQPTLKQSGEKLDANLRRFEIVELAPASDDWQMSSTRILYREPETLAGHPAFFQHAFLPALGGIRVIDDIKKLPPIAAPNP